MLETESQQEHFDEVRLQFATLPYSDGTNATALLRLNQSQLLNQKKQKRHSSETRDPGRDTKAPNSK